MSKIKVLKLGTVCVDKATELKGTLTHWVLDMGYKVSYIFQPKGLDENGQPVPKLFLETPRLKVAEEDFEMIDVPFEVLGTIVTDRASGFKGMAVEFVRHVNGCFHVVIQPRGFSEKTRTAIQKCEFDLRQCTGPKIIELSQKELEDSKKACPSPADRPGRKISDYTC